MAPELRDGRISIFAKRIMRKPRTCIARTATAKSSSRGTRSTSTRRTVPIAACASNARVAEKLYDPMPILRTKPGGPDSMKIETPETKDEAAKKGEKSREED